MQKKAIRKIFREKKEAVTEAQRMKWDDLLLIQFQTLDLPYFDHVLSFYPIEQYREINSFLLTDFLHFRHPALTLCYPKSDTEALTMEAIACHPDTPFESNAWNVPEPVSGEVVDPSLLDMILVPLLAFDEQGFRVGYGKGFYDRFLARCRPDCLTIGLSYFEAVPAIEDKGEFDVPLDLCITPQRIYVF